MAAMPETRAELNEIIQEAVANMFASITQRQDGQDEALANAVRAMRQELASTAAGIDHQISGVTTSVQGYTQQDIAKVSTTIATAEARIREQSTIVQDVCAGLSQQVQDIAAQQSASNQEGGAAGPATEIPRRVPHVSFMGMPGTSPQTTQPAAAPTTTQQQQTPQPQAEPFVFGQDATHAGAAPNVGPGFAGGTDLWARDAPGFASGRTEEFDMFSPPRPGGGRDPKEHVIRMPEIGKLGLRTLLSEDHYKDWCVAFEMAVDDHWAGLEEVLRETKLSNTRLSDLEFEATVDRRSDKPADARKDHWTHRTIARHLYKILFTFVGDNPEHVLKGIVKECEADRDGVEADRLLRLHCDPTTFNTSGSLMDDITDAANRKPQNLDDLIVNIRRTITNLAKYEARCTKLPGAKTTWLPSDGYSHYGPGHTRACDQGRCSSGSRQDARGCQGLQADAESDVEGRCQATEVYARACG